MPEYLAPGVYVEEVSFRAKSIEGVSTSVTGFIGPCRYGPVGGVPELLTSFADFERTYGGIDGLRFTDDGGTASDQVNYMAHAVRAFFDNGGSKLYVTRVFQATVAQEDDDEPGRSSARMGGSPPVMTLQARYPGRAGDARVTFSFKLSGDKMIEAADGSLSLGGLSEHDVVFLRVGAIDATDSQDGFYDVVTSNGALALQDSQGTALDLSAGSPPMRFRAYQVTLNVTVTPAGQFAVGETETDLRPHRDVDSGASLFGAFRQTPTSRLRSLTQPIAIVTATGHTGADLCEAIAGERTSLMQALRRSVSLPEEMMVGSPPEELDPPREDELQVTVELSGGNDGALPVARQYRGSETGTEKTGLETFADIEEISIVAAPGSSFSGGGVSATRYGAITQHLLTHCERMRYRVAVLDSPDGQAVSEVRAVRAPLDSTRAALYYPWVTILDPLDRQGKREIHLPPSGFVTGIYARNDAERGVVKAPANEVVRGALGFEFTLNKAQQDILNPEGVNCFRYFEGRGYRLWGARTISSDPEWKYISLRRYFAYLERSIEKGTQWAVFENNGPRLWSNIRQTISDFLLNEWKSGALLGQSVEEAFFVRCDRSTMTQYNLDNGQLVCLIGVAVVKPAEFVIFRIGQKTADAQ